MKYLLLLFVLAPTLAQAASYSVTTNAAQEAALSRLATEAGATNAQQIQTIIAEYLTKTRQDQIKTDLEAFGRAARFATPAGRVAMLNTIPKPVVSPIAAQTHSVAAKPVVSLQVAATDADAPATSLVYTATNLPPGITISASDGLIFGTPTNAGTFNVTVRAQKALDNFALPTVFAETSFTWTVNP